MLDVYFSPLIDLTELEKDENVTITDEEIVIDCYGKKHSAAIGETWRSKDKVFHLYGWNMAVYYYLYETYGYVFSQDAWECIFSHYNTDYDDYNPELETDGVVYKYLCLYEMKYRLKEILNGRDDELLHKIDADMERLEPDFVKTVKELGIEDYIPNDLLGLVWTDEEIAEFKKRREADRIEFEERMERMMRINPKTIIAEEDLPF